MLDPRRFPVLALALLQCSVFVAIPVVDGVLDARELGIKVHVTAGGGEHCDLGHNHLHCQLARALYLGAAHSYVLPRLRPVIDAGAVPLAENTSAGGPAFSGVRGPRAPPFA